MLRTTTFTHHIGKCMLLLLLLLLLLPLHYFATVLCARPTTLVFAIMLYTTAPSFCCHMLYSTNLWFRHCPFILLSSILYPTIQFLCHHVYSTTLLCCHHVIFYHPIMLPPCYILPPHYVATMLYSTIPLCCHHVIFYHSIMFPPCYILPLHYVQTMLYSTTPLCSHHVIFYHPIMLPPCYIIPLHYVATMLYSTTLLFCHHLGICTILFGVIISWSVSIFRLHPSEYTAAKLLRSRHSA